MKLKKIMSLSFKLKRNSVSVVAIVFLFLLSLIGFYSWWSVSVKTLADKQSFGPNYYKQIPDSKQKDETENWKTYTGLGVNFEYPPSWGVKEYKDIPGVDDSIILSGADVQSKGGFKVNSIAIVLTKGNQSSINDPLFASMCKSSGKDCVEKNIQLNGVTAIQRDYFATTPWGINKTERQRVTTITKNYLTVFIKQERFVENESTFLTPYDKILSTFKFLGQNLTGDINDWKTYRQVSQKIEFKYPANWYLKEVPERTFSVVLSPNTINLPYGTDAPLGPIIISLNECTDTRNGQKYPCGDTIDKYIENLGQYFEINGLRNPMKQVEVNFLGLKARQITDAPKSIKQTVLPWGKYLLIINLTTPDLESIYNQILASFKTF